jgi:thiosulfate/3-mercaptopyruvate sulfurtransferase
MWMRMTPAIVYDPPDVYKVCSGNGPGFAMTSKTNLISANGLQSKLSSPNWRILDCRFDLADPDAGHRAYLDGHIPGALFADLEKDLSGAVSSKSGRHPLPDVRRMERRLGELGIDAGTGVVVYDWNSGAVAARTWWTLRWLGHFNVCLLDGGLDRWSRLGFALNRGNEATESRRFLAQPRDDQVLTTPGVVAGIAATPGLRLFDARDARRFIGEIEPIDAVAGHIPGATSLPFDASLNADMTWKPVAELERLWLEQLGNDRNIEWAVMCGSGVTACHLALSAVEAGFAEPRLYAGSWSEWIRDPRRPVALGEGP